MKSKRIEALAEFVLASDTVLDVGCDHGYLSIYLKKNHLCKNVIASDISSNALEMARQNFQKYGLDIATYVSDGFNDIPSFFDTAVIAGMGCSTILNILQNKKCPSKLIISSHNELARLRYNLNKLNFKIEKEKIIYEKGHYYSIMLCHKGYQKLNYQKRHWGLDNNQEYYLYLFNKNKELIKKVPGLKKLKLKYQNYLLKGLIEKK